MRVSPMHTPKSLKAVVLSAGLALTCMLLPVLSPAQLTPQQAAGRQIYTEGVSPSRAPIEAILGDGSTRIPAQLIPCAGCHGPDGKGRPEGGVVPSDIRWDFLTRPHRSAGPLDRQRPAYDNDTLKRSITAGVDSAGNELGIVMPLFRMAPEDLESLVEYIKLLDRQSEPGLTGTAIRVGMIVPREGPFARTGKGSVDLIRAFFDELNEQGGV